MAKATDANALFVGDEPVASKLVHTDPEYKINFIRALNWYSANKNPKDARNWIYAAAKAAKHSQVHLDGIKNLRDDEVPTTCGWCVRLVSRGAKLSKVHLMTISDRLSKLFARFDAEHEIAVAQAKSKLPTKPMKSVQEYMADKIRDFLGDCEGHLDDRMADASFMTGDKDFYRWLQGKEIPAAYIPMFIEWCDMKIREFGGVMLTKDEQIKEGYSNFSKRELKDMVMFLQSMKEQATGYASFKKVNRAPRKRKEQPPAKVAAKVKYKNMDDDFKLTSAFPADAVGAEQLWVFNCKTRVLQAYRASGSTGISFKGTTVINFDTETSEQKRLRKPEQVLAKLKDAGKVQLRKLLTDIKAVNYVPNGRLNKDCVLVRVVR